MRQPDDQALGMDRAISRRDFLDGARVALTGSLAYSWFEPATVSGQAQLPVPYPPAVTVLRGRHDGAREVAHAVRDGKKLLGHSEVRVTADLDTHPQKQTATKAATIMDAVLNS